MSKKNELDKFDNAIEVFLKKDPNYDETSKFVKKHIENAYYGFLRDRVKIKVKGNERLYEYEINKDDPLALLRFYHQSKRTQEELPKNFDELILFLNSNKGAPQKEVHPTDTIASLKSTTSLGNDDDERWYFSFELPPDKRDGKMTKQAKKGGKKRKRKKKKKAFPSRKKNNRKNRTKKKTLSK